MSEKDELAELRRIVEDHITSDDKRYKHYDDVHEKNTTDISNLITALATLTRATQGLVDGWIAARAIQRFIKWLSGFAFLGAISAWAAGKLPL